MAQHADIAEHFHFFHVDTGASLGEIDQKYWRATNSLHRERASHPETARAKQTTIDDHYLALLKHFLRTRPPQRRPDVSYEDVALRRPLPPPMHEPPSPRSSFLNSWRPETKLVSADVPRAKALEMYQKYFEEHMGSEKETRAKEDVKSDTDPISPPDSSSDKVCLAGWQLNYEVGDIINEIPDKSVIIHATNCMGVWGKGFAAELKRCFPEAYNVYRSHCLYSDWGDIVGTCLVIRPQAQDWQRPEPLQNLPRRFIACLFTSAGYGRPRGKNPGKSDMADILTYTDSAIENMIQVLDDMEKGMIGRDVDSPGGLFSPRINSGHFKVPWDKTSRLIHSNFRGLKRTWTIYVEPRMADQAEQSPVSQSIEDSDSGEEEK